MRPRRPLAHGPRRYETAEASSARPSSPAHCRQTQLPALLSEAADTFLAGLLEHATQGKNSGYALIAVGGYGRSALCPGSDLDVVLLHRRRRHVERIADAIWYTVWDTGLHLDHSVRTRGEALEMAGSDMKVVLGLLDARHIAGDEALSQPTHRADRDALATRRNRSSGSALELRHGTASKLR